MEKKSFLEVPFIVETKSEDEEFFRFEGYGSTFGNTDLGRDVVERGAFKASLEKRRPKLLPQRDTKEFPLGVIEYW